MNDRKNTGKTAGKMREFSIALGLLDYVNPVFYTVTSLTLIRHLKGTMNSTLYMIYLAGAVISLIGGYAIPTGKVLVGMKIIKFRMPVSIVFFVNSGILFSGLALGAHVLHLSTLAISAIFLAAAAFLAFIIAETHKFNTAAVLCGAIGYLLIYFSLILTSLIAHMILPVILYLAAICLFVFLCFIGIKADLYDAEIHWIIEISNVICQGLVALATYILFFGF